MTNSQINFLPPNKKITLTVNAVNINKPAVSAGFINLMYIWQYQSRWLKLGKFASHDNWVDLVDYKNEITSGIYQENKPVNFNYYSVFGYQVNFRLVIYSKNSLIAKSTSNNVLKRYDKAIVSNLIKTICNDQQNVKVDLSTSELTLNNQIKLIQPTSIDFFVKIANAIIYENNQIAHNQSSVHVIFEEYADYLDAWTTVANLPLLFEDKVLLPLQCSINFNKDGVYTIRAKIVLEKGWQIAPIISNEIKVNAVFSSNEINFDQIKTIVDYNALNSFKGGFLDLTKNKTEFLFDFYFSNTVDNQAFQNQNKFRAYLDYYLNNDEYFDSNHSLIVNSYCFLNNHQYLPLICYLTPNQNYSLVSNQLDECLIIPVNNELGFSFIGLMINFNHNFVSISKLLSLLDNSQKHSYAKLNGEENKSLALMNLNQLKSFNLSNQSNQIDCFGWLDYLLKQKNKKLDSLFINQSIYSSLGNEITFFILHKDYLINKKWLVWKNELVNTLLFFLINSSLSLQTNNQKNWSYSFIQLIYNSTYFFDIFHFAISQNLICLNIEGLYPNIYLIKTSSSFHPFRLFTQLFLLEDLNQSNKFIYYQVILDNPLFAEQLLSLVKNVNEKN